MTPLRWILPATLRARVTAVAALAVLAVLTAVSVGLRARAARRPRWRRLDENLDQQADAVASRLRGGAAGP